jgi:hypothetical protein
VPQPAVGVDDAAHPQGGDPLLQPPRRALGRRPVADHRAEHGVGVGLAEAPEAQRAVVDLALDGAAGVGPVEPERGQRGEQLEADADPALPVGQRLAGRGHGVQRQPAPEEQRVADAVALEAPLGQAELLAQRRAGREQVQPMAGGGVDRGDGLAAEAQHGACDRLHAAGDVERRDELDPLPLAAAPLVQRAELLVGGRRRDVDAAIAHGCDRAVRQPARRPRRSTASSSLSSGVVSEMRKKPSPLGP